MAMSGEEILSVFDTSVPEAFTKQLFRRLFGTYQAANLRCSEFPAPEKHDLLPHVRRALLEADLRGAAKTFGFKAAAEPNKTKNSYHTIVLTDRIALTASAVPSPNSVVRTAIFRGTLAATSQLNLYSVDEDQEVPLYAIIVHGPDEEKPQQPGFCRIAFPDLECQSYVYEIDLFERYKEMVQELRTGAVELIGDEVWPELRKDIAAQQTEAI